MSIEPSDTILKEIDVVDDWKLLESSIIATLAGFPYKFYRYSTVTVSYPFE